MVLKFDHVSYSCDETEQWQDFLPAGYKEEFQEKGLPNIACKMPYLRYASKTHDIHMLRSERGGIPIEVTVYPKTDDKATGMMLVEDGIELDVSDCTETKRLFGLLGFVASEDRQGLLLSMKPFLDSRECRIFLKKSKNPRDRKLDSRGYTSLAFFVDHAGKLEKLIKAEGFASSGTSLLTVNGKELEIAFVAGANGELIELISLAGKEKNENH